MTAGIYRGDAEELYSWADVERSLSVNLIGVVRFVVGVVERLGRAHKRARIAVVSSAASEVGSHDVGYGVAKAGLAGLVRSISKARARHGITIIGVAPGLFDSDMSKSQSSQRRDAAIMAMHLGRTINLDEIVACVRFAVFDAPDALSGTFLNPNGGQV